MTYPPNWRKNHAPLAAVELTKLHPIANLVTTHTGLLSTKIPFVADVTDGQIRTLRGHLNAQNPQMNGIEGQSVLVTFAGRSSYVSPHWRTNLDRAGTINFEEVQVRGVVKLRPGLPYFKRLIDDLALLFEPQFTDIGDFPVWNTQMAPEGYIERLFPAIKAFEIEVTSVEMISKLHQQFPEEDRVSVANHLQKSGREDSRIIGEKIRATIGS